MWASLRGHVAVMDLLLQHDAKVDIHDKVLIIFCLSAFLDPNKASICYSCPSVQQQGKTPLIIACEYGHTSAVELLLEYKAPLNVQDKVRDA